MAKRRKPAAKKSGRGRSPKSSTPRLPSAPSTSGGIPVVCSECYSDFVFIPGSSATTANCPDCMHSGQVPESSELARIGMAKASEKKAFLAAVVPGILFVLVGMFYLIQLNGAGTQEALGSAMNYSLMGGTLLLFLITLVFAARYEKSRSEVYF